MKKTQEPEFPEQVERIQRALLRTGMTLDDLAGEVDVNPSTLKKYASGGQKAGENLLKLVDRVGAQLPTFDRDNDGRVRETAPRQPSLGDKLDFILRAGSSEEIGAVRALLDTMHATVVERRRPLKILRVAPHHRLRALLGAIPAGVPAEAIAQADQFVSVPDHLAKRVDFGLQARGESMIDRDIQDGDIILFSTQIEPRNGNVVAALIDREVTLKTYVEERGRVYLKSANKLFPPEIVPQEEMRVQGVMVGKL